MNLEIQNENEMVEASAPRNEMKSGEMIQKNKKWVCEQCGSDQIVYCAAARFDRNTHQLYEVLGEDHPCYNYCENCKTEGVDFLTEDEYNSLLNFTVVEEDEAIISKTHFEDYEAGFDKAEIL